MDPLLPYLIISCSFGVFAIGVFLAGRAAGWGEKFPGKLYTPLILVALLFSVGSMTSVILGAEKEQEHKAHEKAAAHENGESGNAAENEN